MELLNYVELTTYGIDMLYRLKEYNKLASYFLSKNEAYIAFALIKKYYNQINQELLKEDLRKFIQTNRLKSISYLKLIKK